MISIQDLEMIPPISGKERTYAWYPPSYDQYSKVPYKTMAVLDDFKYFHKDDTKDKIEQNKEDKHVVENGDTVLSSKLNAVRQELTKRRVTPNVIRQQCFIKPNSVQEYLKIPETWKPKYPEANIDILTEENYNKRESIDHKENVDQKENDEQKENVEQKENISNITEVKSFSKDQTLNLEESRLFKKPLIRRPYTAPGNTFPVKHSSRCSSVSVESCQRLPEAVIKSRKPSALLQNRLRQSSASESSLSCMRYNYDLEKYKWLMEIPTDPFNIKGPHLPAKQQYFQSVADFKVLPQEPHMQKQSRDTFFYNSMPVESLSFDINPNFMSEKYNKMKNHLRSQGKWNYSSKNFSFVY